MPETPDQTRACVLAGLTPPERTVIDWFEANNVSEWLPTEPAINCRDGLLTYTALQFDGERGWDRRNVGTGKPTDRTVPLLQPPDDTVMRALYECGLTVTLDHGAPHIGRPYRQSSEPGDERRIVDGDVIVWQRQIGWHGATGAFYSLAEDPSKTEPGSFGPIWIDIDSDTRCQLTPGCQHRSHDPEDHPCGNYSRPVGFAPGPPPAHIDPGQAELIGAFLDKGATVEMAA